MKVRKSTECVKRNIDWLFQNAGTGDATFPEASHSKLRTEVQPRIPALTPGLSPTKQKCKIIHSIVDRLEEPRPMGWLYEARFEAELKDNDDLAGRTR